MRSGIVPTPRGAFAVRDFAPEGPSAGLAPVICLHGFPDDASTFDAVAERLSQHGHPVTSVYLRGYDPSPTVGPYSMGGLGEDLIALATEVYGGQAVHFLGHDYGAQIAYSVLSQAPGLFRSAVLLAGAHPAAISRNTWRYPRQIWLSRYIIFFQFGRFADRTGRTNRLRRIGPAMGSMVSRRDRPRASLDRQGNDRPQHARPDRDVPRRRILSREQPHHRPDAVHRRGRRPLHPSRHVRRSGHLLQRPVRAADLAGRRSLPTARRPASHRTVSSRMVPDTRHVLIQPRTPPPYPKFVREERLNP